MLISYWVQVTQCTRYKEVCLLSIRGNQCRFERRASRERENLGEVETDVLS